MHVSNQRKKDHAKATLHGGIMLKKTMFALNSTMVVVDLTKTIFSQKLLVNRNVYIQVEVEVNLWNILKNVNRNYTNVLFIQPKSVHYFVLLA